MSCCNHSWRSADGESHVFGGARPPWKPLELAAMVFGFVVFWPIGLAILGLKMASRRHGAEDLFGFAREQAERFREGWSFTSTFTEEPRRRGFASATGNTAFDDWRRAELERLEEERRKLAQAERDFADHIDQLRRARDREEFDSFMKSRNV